MHINSDHNRKSNLTVVQFPRSAPRRKRTQRQPETDRVVSSLYRIVRILRQAERKAIEVNPRSAGAVTVGQCRIGLERAVRGRSFEPDPWKHFAGRVIATGGSIGGSR